MNKGTAIRAGILFGLFVIILGAAWAVSSVKDKNVSAEILNPNESYVTVGDVTITRQDLWNTMKLADGLTYLEQYIEENYFLKDEIALVTQSQIDEKIEYYRYGTNDPDIILEIQDDPEVEANLQEQYENSLIILGFDPTDADDLRAFVELEIAKENYARKYVIAADDDDLLSITDADVEAYYESINKGDVCAVNVIFNSTVEAESIFEEFSLVPNYNLGWGEYFGTEDYSTLTTGDFDETNTNQLTDEEIFDKFVEMYKFMNPNSLVPETNTFTSLCADFSDEFSYDYTEMTEGRVTGDPYITLAGYLFDTLNFEDDGARFSYTLQTLGEFDVLTYKVSANAGTAYADLTAQELTDLEAEFLDEKLTTAVTLSVISNLWDAAEYEIFDPVLKVKNLFDGGDEYSNKGDDSKIATINGNDITADMLFDYMDEKIGTYYTLDMIKSQLILNSAAYTDLYEDDYDYLNSNLPKIKEHRDELRNMKTAFSSDTYAQYGFSSSVYSWDEFILLAFNSYDEEEAIQNLFVLTDLQPYYARESVSYTNAADIIQKQIDEYFSLDVKHLLVYVDMDKDFTPDDFNDYVDELTGEDETAYNDLFNDLETLIEQSLNDDMSFDEIVTEFNDSLLNDPTNVWAEAKQFGFHILTQDLSTTDSLNNTTTSNYDVDFVAAVKDLYDEYTALIGASIGDVDELFDDELIQTNFGLHYLYAEQGNAFTVPSAEYSEIDDLDSAYPVEANNDSMIPTQDQVNLYIEIEYSNTTGKATDAKLPTSVYTAIDTYFGDTYLAYFSSGSQTIITVDYILANNAVYATDSANRLIYIDSLLAVLYNNTFPEEYIVPE